MSKHEVTIKTSREAQGVLKSNTTHKDQTYSDVIVHMAKQIEIQNRWIPKISYVAKRTAEEIEDGKKKGHVSPSIADELLSLVQEFIAELEQR